MTSLKQRRQHVYDPCNDFEQIHCNTCGRTTKHKMTRIYLAASDGRMHWEGWCMQCLNVNEHVKGRKVAEKYPHAPLPWLDGRPTA